MKFHFDKKYFLIYSKCFVHSHSVNTGCWISSISEHSALVTSIFFHLNMVFFYSTCYVNNCYWIQQHFYIKQIWFFLKIYRSSIFRKYIVHFFVTTVLFWKSNFQIRMYHKKITYLVYNCTTKKQKDSLVFYVHKFCLNSVNNISNIRKGRTSYLIFTK